MARDLEARMPLVAMAIMASEVAGKEIEMETWQFWLLFGVLMLILSVLLWRKSNQGGR